MSETLVIDRADWLTGTPRQLLQGSGGALCDDKSQQMCCLGFYGLKQGETKRSMMGRGYLSSFNSPTWLTGLLDKKDNERFGEGGEVRMQVESALVVSNDGDRHPIRREAAIAYLFKKYGSIDVTFIGKYADGTKRAKAALKKAA